MRVLTWNINFRNAKSIAGISTHRPDIVFLQEVTHGAARQIVEALAAVGCKHAIYSGSSSYINKRYGNITASRWPILPPSGIDNMPWPQLALRCTISDTDCGDIDTFNIHIPNGSNNGWSKVDSIAALANALESAPDCPRIVAGDFNEPQTILPCGSVVTFGQIIESDGSVRLGRRLSGSCNFTDKHGETRNLEQWDCAVRRIFEGAAHHGLRHVRNLQGHVEIPVTHVVQGKPRFFDHMFISRHLCAETYLYDDSVRRDLRYSDHSALLAEIFLSQSV